MWSDKLIIVFIRISLMISNAGNFSVSEGHLCVFFRQLSLVSLACFSTGFVLGEVSVMFFLLCDQRYSVVGVIIEYLYMDIL